MAAALNQDFTMFQGDVATIEFTVKDEAGVVINITGADITWALSRKLKVPFLVTKSVGSGVTIVNGPAGRADVALVLADTNALEGDFEHELVVNGQTVSSGVITIKASTIK